MARRVPPTLGFDAITIEGGLIAPEMLGRIGATKAGEQSEAEYGLDPGVKIRDEIGFAFSIAETLWARFRQGANVERFADDLLRQVFGFRSLTATPAPQAGGITWPVRRSALGGRVPVVVAPPPAENVRKSGLDESFAPLGDGNRRRSATLLVQEFLNAADTAMWGIAIDGHSIRILRRNASLTRPAWIEADLARILSERMFADFSVLWLLLHESRFGKAVAAPADCPLERWRETARAEGVAARGRLRDGVEAALKLLGQGFLLHADNGALRTALSAGTLSPQEYFQELLRLVYRFIFLFTAEDRNLLHPPQATEAARHLYADGYALGRLRERAVRRTAYDRHHDLYEGVKLVSGRLAAGEPKLALPALGGLFMPGTTPHLDQAKLANRDLLAALFRLAWLPVDSRLERVNWHDMSPEELGSVYESLLELTPRLDQGCFVFAQGSEAKGNARKTSGSYYTPDSLVELLLDSALDPVIDAAVAAHPGKEVAALLDLDVIDPACGSGHFLLAAARRIAGRIAQYTSPGAPSAEDYRHALREVARHCLYGADRNPMAVELCKVALWIETLEPGKPLSYLDGRIRCGDSLIGVFDLGALADGIPDEAYKPLTGDDKAVARYFTARNRKERKDRPSLPFAGSLAALAQKSKAIDDMDEDDLAHVRRKAEADASLRNTPDSRLLKVACDLVVSAFFAPKEGEVPANPHMVTIPTTDHLWRKLAGHQIYGPLEDAAIDIAAQAAAFHWPLAFPEVFAKGGFDCVVGNPPWERMKLQEQEFFAARAPEIAAAPNKAARERLIAALTAPAAGDVDRRLHADFQFAKREAEAGSLFARASGRYPLTGVGDVNTYALFAEHFTRLVNRRGRAGIILPTGIATDATTSAFFGWLTDEKRLVQFLDFQTGMGFFDDIGHARFKFALMTVGAAGASEGTGIRLAFFLRQMSDLDQPERFFSLSAEDIARLNPNTKTLATFRSRADAELTAKIYAGVPVLIDEAKGTHGNPWGIRFARMFDMSTDSGLFRTAAQLAAAGAMRDGAEWRAAGGDRWLPLYEAKMVHHFDHRWATYDDGSTGDDDSRLVTAEEKADSGFEVRPRYWVPAREVYLRIANLPEGLLTALRRNDTRLIVLGIVHLLFGHWLRQAGIRTTGETPGIFPLWRDFVARHPVARPIAPTSLGLAGDNPPSMRPTGPDDLPAEPIDAITTDGRDRTAWYAVDDTVLMAYLGFAGRYEGLVSDTPPLDSESDALALAETLLEKASPRWLMGWRDICRSTDERTTISGAIPRAGVGDKFLLLSAAVEPRRQAALLATMASLSFDYVARQKVGGTSFKYFTMRQIACPPPSAFTEDDLAFIVPRVLELVYTSHAMKPFAEALGYDKPPFPWDGEQRSRLRAELDAHIARFYDLNRKNVNFILDPAPVMGADYPTETFRVLKENETRRFGEYRTGRLVLEAWDRQEAVAAAENNVVTLPTQARQPRPLPDLRAIRAGDWARPMTNPRGETMEVLLAVLTAMDRPLPAERVRLATLLALEPHLLAPHLEADRATQWARAIGGEASGPAADSADLDGYWGAALRHFRSHDWLAETNGNWGPGANLGSRQAGEWAAGRAAAVWDAMRLVGDKAEVFTLFSEQLDRWRNAEAA